jgi:hypothetical protein
MDKKALYWAETTNQPAPTVVVDPTFNKMWNDLLSDMALPFWRWRYPLSSERQENWKHD